MSDDEWTEWMDKGDGRQVKYRKGTPQWEAHVWFPRFVKILFWSWLGLTASIILGVLIREMLAIL